MRRAGWLVLVLVGCGPTETPAPTPEPAPVVAPEPEVAKASAIKVLAPSPLRLELEVREAGVADTLADLVPADGPKEPFGPDIDRAAMKTGVLFAYTMLGGRTSEKQVFLHQVRLMRGGMATIGAGQGLLSSMDRAIEKIQNDAGSRDDFLVQLDQEVQYSVPEEGWGPNDTSGPLVQAGAWLAGLNLVAQAVVRKDDAAAADKLLRRPEVTGFFLEYVKVGEGREKVDSTAGAVVGALTELDGVAKREKLTVEDAKQIVEITDKLLKLLQ